MAESTTFVLVGHCGPDAHLLKAAVSRAVPGSIIAVANDQRSLQPHLHRGAVLLVNRALDGSFDATDGVVLIERLMKGDDLPATMLVSNFADAQEKAVAAGAKPGFGKSAVYKESTKTLVRSAAGLDQEKAT